jgi:hypothetical protein
MRAATTARVDEHYSTNPEQTIRKGNTSAAPNHANRTSEECPKAGAPLSASAAPIARAHRRRRVSPESGRALEILGHAIEYLVDEFALQIGTSGWLHAEDPQLQAVQILKAANRAVYYDCPVVPTRQERFREWWGRRGQHPLWKFAMRCGRWTPIALALLVLCFLLACSSASAESRQPYSSSANPVVIGSSAGVRLSALDKTLYASIAGYRALDYLSTRHALARGAHENVLPSWVVNSPGTFIAFEALATATEVGSSILLIRHRHRRTAIVMNGASIGLGVLAVVGNYRQSGLLDSSRANPAE